MLLAYSYIERGEWNRGCDRELVCIRGVCVERGLSSLARWHFQSDFIAACVLSDVMISVESLCQT
jgi:hypothetical protein